MNAFKRSFVWRGCKQFGADPIRRGIAKICNCGRVPVAYCDVPNWGDALNPILVELLSGRKVQHLENLFHDRYLVIGSILEGANSHAVVWGSGFIGEGSSTIEPPRSVCAVRGPLSRAALIKAGTYCPPVYGDPALLLPWFFNPIVDRRYEIGILPHYVDKDHPWVKQHENDPHVLIIDVEGGIGSVIRAVKSCNIILSSSLHGLILADSYGIPNAWINLSNLILGGHFKFRDYRLSIGAGEPHAFNIRMDSSLKEVSLYAEPHELKIDLRKLLLACPFLHPQLRNTVISAPQQSCGLPDRLQSSIHDETALQKMFF